MKRTALTTLLLVALAALSGCSKDLVCAGDQLVCSDACTSIRTDAKNCGACGHACGSGEACQAGVCTDCAATGTCAVAVYAACFDTNAIQGATQDLVAAGEPLATDAGPDALVPVGGELWVANDLSNTLSRVTFAGTRAIQNQAVTLTSVGYSDLSYLAVHAGLLYASNAPAGTLVVIDPVAKAVRDEIPLGAAGEGVNPQGIGFVQDRAYVALQANYGYAPLNAVAVVDVSKEATCAHPASGSCGQVLARIDAGANALPYRVLPFTEGVGATGKVYVTLANLDASFNPAGDGKLAVIDPSTQTVAQTVTLTGCQDPAELALVGSTLWVACGFQAYGTTPPATGAGFLPVDLSTSVPTVQSLVATTQQPGSVALCGGKIYAGDRASGAMLRLDPAARTVTVSGSPICPANSHGNALVSAVSCAL
ncbi:hypothetical protein [Anaeromyxobacter paludicola]|uniref:Lipoprotein n=1 Tax=Anaeromyxobacter paludicola TaxID=2918171 RepID=A0ABM7XF05_9BACT|nr:hypothetical protein [Anaeromyxobacter paludicola]BDG10455.1 hypothetical protein AMPC_35680 [Anaeromyxobacter paludicola]